MDTFKINISRCTDCLSTISSGQAAATKLIFASALCVNCLEGYTKLDSMRGWKSKEMTLQKAS